MPGKDIKTQRTLTDQEIETIQQLLNGSVLRPGERILTVILLDVSRRLEDQNTLMMSLLQELKGVTPPAGQIEARPKVSERPQLNNK